MRIENEIKMDFKDVMIRPKRSKIKSRADVILSREFRFMHTPSIYRGIPIVASNMDRVGTFEMALCLAEKRMFTIIHKHYSIEEWHTFLSKLSSDCYDFIAISIGTTTNA